MAMDRIIFQVEQDIHDGGYVAEAFVTENEHIVTQGDTVDELKEMIKDALACHFDDVNEMPREVVLNFIRQEVFAI